MFGSDVVGSRTSASNPGIFSLLRLGSRAAIASRPSKIGVINFRKSASTVNWGVGAGVDTVAAALLFADVLVVGEDRILIVR